MGSVCAGERDNMHEIDYTKDGVAMFDNEGQATAAAKEELSE